MNRYDSNIKMVKVGFHLLIVLLLLIMPQPFPEHPVQAFFRSRWYSIAPWLITFYILNVAWFVPSLLMRRRYVHFGIAALISTIAFPFLVKWTWQLFYAPSIVQSPFQGLPKMAVVPFMTLMTIGTGFELLVNWEKQRRVNEEIQKEKVTAELAFLKSQINPHFLFNSLNNIWSLVRAKSAKAEEAILMLSELLRYMLYKSDDQQVMLSEEIKHIENFVALQKLRISSKHKVLISMDKSGLNGLEAQIEPMVLIPFVENAFKHGLSYSGKSEILIGLRSSDSDHRELQFQVSNTIKSSGTSEEELDMIGSGIGLKNVKRRLQLLYNRNHQLQITHGPERFEVDLKLKL